jgi:signal transduction histidine kinase
VELLNLFTGIIRDVTRRKELEEEVINASENERLNIAYDLHDDLGSLLTGIKLGIESMATMLQQDDPARAGRAREIAGQVSEAMVKTRDIATGLRPVGSEPDDLMDALEALSRRMQEASGIEVRFVCQRAVMIAGQVMANHLFRIAQEAVSNAVRHSGGDLIVISLQRVDWGIELMVEDNGSGMIAPESGHGGLGLHAMSYRASALRGALRITAGRNGGVKVLCLIPSPEQRP